MSNTRQQAIEYVIVGAGPAAITAIPNLLNRGVNPKDILWIDPKFTVGDFGGVLSTGSSVPGNTNAKNYQKVNTAIYQILAKELEKQPSFMLDSLAPQMVCSLKVAAEPLQFITDKLIKMVNAIHGLVSQIDSTPQGLKLDIKNNAGECQQIYAKRVILATGAKPKSMNLPLVTLVEPNVVFIASELAEYLQHNPHVQKVAVIGSSHSAALATMHLLNAGVKVKQFMNKEYKFATPAVSEKGIEYTQFDNTGLKGDVAVFTRALLARQEKNWEKLMGKNQEEMLRELADCAHAVVAIGYEPNSTLRVNGLPLMQLKHDSKTTAFVGVPGLFGIGVAFPELVTAISGEVEFAVGVGKFWSTASRPETLDLWRDKTAQINEVRTDTQRFFYHTEKREQVNTLENDAVNKP